MATRGKSINLFLMDGEASGRIKCTLANWTGIAYKIPRTELGKCKDRDDLKQSGVYFLFGTSDQTGESVVYIGQAGARKNGEGILYCLKLRCNRFTRNFSFKKKHFKYGGITIESKTKPWWIYVNALSNYVDWNRNNCRCC